MVRRFVGTRTKAGNKIIQLGISNNLEELKEDFYVYGIKMDESFEEFILGEDYSGFLWRC